MLRSYSFAKVTKREATADSHKNAVMLTSVDEILSATESKGYSFMKDSDLTKDLTAKYRKAVKMVVTHDFTANGTKTNKVKIYFEGAPEKGYNISIFGAKKELKPDGEYDNETIKKCVFGVCQSAGEVVASDGWNKNGEPIRIPTVYVVFPDDQANL